MDHFIGHALHGIDSTREPLSKVIRGYNELREHPHRFLASQEVVIGSAPYWALSCMVGFIVFMAPIIGLGLLFDSLQKNGGTVPPLVEWLFLILFAGCFFLPFCLVPFLVPRRTITLRRDGVVFAEPYWQVVCPWELFCTLGDVQVTREDRVFIPVNPEAIGRVKLIAFQRRTANGWAVRASFFWLRRAAVASEAPAWKWLRAKVTGTPPGVGDHAVFLNVYKASGLDIGRLLVELAWKMERQCS